MCAPPHATHAARRGSKATRVGASTSSAWPNPSWPFWVLAPRVAAAVLGERHRVRAAARHLHDARRGEGAHRPRLERTFAVRVAATQLAVAVATEAPRDAALRERERVSAAARHLQQEEVCVAHRMAHRVPRAAGGCAW